MSPEFIQISHPVKIHLRAYKRMRIEIKAQSGSGVKLEMADTSCKGADLPGVVVIVRLCCIIKPDIYSTQTRLEFRHDPLTQTRRPYSVKIIEYRPVSQARIISLPEAKQDFRSHPEAGRKHERTAKSPKNAIQRWGRQNNPTAEKIDLLIAGTVLCRPHSKIGVESLGTRGCRKNK